MRDGALKWGLRLLGIALTIGPLLIALGTHNWDIKAAVLPSEAEIKEIEDSVKGIFGGGPSENTLSIGSPTPTGNNTFRVSITFASPFNIPIKITDFSGYVACGDHPSVRLGQVSMQDDNVEIPPQGTRTITVIGTLTTGGIQHLADFHSGSLPSSIRPENMNVVFDIYGVSVQVRISVTQGGP